MGPIISGPLQRMWQLIWALGTGTVGKKAIFKAVEFIHLKFRNFKTTALIKWLNPREGWHKLNTDGSWQGKAEYMLEEATKMYHTSHDSE
ncbi:uncharacterized protein G2W53_030491 [Senna tora]|uniref:Uncharacterized protein n=1 Tax=Senna tora TaxID=362788 RepID=A0A834T751_9FABA|nr:uncharacterized protein G2W53_030491 [Senna tora]